MDLSKKIEFTKAMEAAINQKRDAEYDGLMKRFFPGAVTKRERAIFDRRTSLRASQLTLLQLGG